MLRRKFVMNPGKKWAVSLGKLCRVVSCQDLGLCVPRPSDSESISMDVVQWTAKRLSGDQIRKLPKVSMVWETYWNTYRTLWVSQAIECLVESKSGRLLDSYRTDWDPQAIEGFAEPGVWKSVEDLQENRTDRNSEAAKGLLEPCAGRLLKYRVDFDPQATEGLVESWSGRCTGIQN